MGYFFNRKLKLKEFEMRMKAKAEMRIATAKMVTPLKIQAYERFLLFLERSQLPVLVKRVYAPGMAKEMFHISLLHSIEEEFEHNLAQQLYVGNDTWMAVQRAKAWYWPHCSSPWWAPAMWGFPWPCCFPSRMT